MPFQAASPKAPLPASAGLKSLPLTPVPKKLPVKITKVLPQVLAPAAVKPDPDITVTPVDIDNDVV